MLYSIPSSLVVREAFNRSCSVFETSSRLKSRSTLSSLSWSKVCYVNYLTCYFDQHVAGALPPHAFKARYGFLCIAVSFSFPAGPLLLSWLTANLRNTGASTLAIPMNVSVGQIGQIAGTQTDSVYIVQALANLQANRGIHIQDVRGSCISYGTFHLRRISSHGVC